LKALGSVGHQRIGSDVSDPARADAIEDSGKGRALPYHVTLAAPSFEVRQVGDPDLLSAALRPALDLHALLRKVTLSNNLRKHPRRDAAVGAQGFSVGSPV